MQSKASVKVVERNFEIQGGELKDGIGYIKRIIKRCSKK